MSPIPQTSFLVGTFFCHTARTSRARTFFFNSRLERLWQQNTIDFFNNSSLNPRFPVKLYAFQIFAIFRTLHLEQIEMWTQRGTIAAKDALCSE